MLGAKSRSSPGSHVVPNSQLVGHPAAELIDIDSASADQLNSMAGIGDAYSKRIIDGRPYANKTQLVSRKIIPQATYDKIKNQIIARQNR